MSINSNNSQKNSGVSSPFGNSIPPNPSSNLRTQSQPQQQFQISQFAHAQAIAQAHSKAQAKAAAQAQANHAQFQAQLQAQGLVVNQSHGSLVTSSPSVLGSGNASGKRVPQKAVGRPPGSNSNSVSPMRTMELTPATRHKKKQKLPEKQLQERVAAILPSSALYTELLEFESRLDAALVRKKMLGGGSVLGSRRVVQISAGFMIFVSVLGKFGAVFASIPVPIVAALYCLFFAFVGSSGLSFLQFCNLNSFRTKFILGFSLFLGLSIPQYFNEYEAIKGFGPVHTSGRWFNNMVNVPFSSEAFVGGLVAYFLDNTLQRKNDSAIRKDRGKNWWDKFRSFHTDTRSEEFYSLPFNLNKYFPAV